MQKVSVPFPAECFLWMLKKQKNWTHPVGQINDLKVWLSKIYEATSWGKRCLALQLLFCFEMGALSGSLVSSAPE